MIPTQDSSLSENKNKTENNIGQGITLSFNFETGEFDLKDGRIIKLSGVEALKMWIEKVIKTEKHKFKIYSKLGEYVYGITLLDYINTDLPIGFIYAEIQRELTETLLKNSLIKGVSNFNFDREDETLKVSFDISTIYGTFTNEVNV